MAHLNLDRITKTYSDGTQAVRGITFEVNDREAVFLLGPSGAGKTTTLRLVAGLEDLDGGRISIGNVDRSTAVPRDRNVAMVYDKHSLFPHLSVFENLAYPLRIRKMSDADMRARIGSVAEVLQVVEQLQKMPSQLSGGQQQRVAIGRALVRDADVFLLDEPISHLDAQLRARMRVEFKRLQRDFDATMLYVSHDQLEAMTMADRIVLINQGQIEQIDAPQMMFDQPKTLFTATFLGEPSMNTLPVRLVEDGGAYWLEIGASKVPVDRDWINTASGRLKGSDATTLGVRPQHLSLASNTEQSNGIVPGTLYALEVLGSRVIFDVQINDRIVRVMTTVDEARKHPSAIGAAIAIRMPSEFFYLFDSAGGQTLLQAKFTSNEKPEIEPGSKRVIQ